MTLNMGTCLEEIEEFPLSTVSPGKTDLKHDNKWANFMYIKLCFPQNLPQHF